MAAEQINSFPEQTAPSSSLNELQGEQLKNQTEELFKFSRDWLVRTQEFTKALRSSAIQTIPVGNFEFKVNFDGRNYSYSIALEDVNKNKKLKIRKSFDYSYNGPTISEDLEIERGENPSFSYIYEVSDEPSDKRTYKNSPEAAKQIKLFFLLI